MTKLHRMALQMDNIVETPVSLKVNPVSNEENVTGSKHHFFHFGSVLDTALQAPHA